MRTNEVKRAVVLAAGLGTRLRPVTSVIPKPLLPLGGVPMLERVIRELEHAGVEEIAVNAHWLPEQIRAFAAKRKGRARITVSEEPEILGTGGVLNPLRSFLGDSPFWLVNSDIAFDGLDLQDVVDAFDRSGGFAGCWMSSVQGPRTIEADFEGRVCNWKSDVPGDDGTFTYCGLALLSPKILDYLPPTGFSTIVSAYEKAMMEDGRFVVGTDPEDAWWADCGTLESYLEANAAFNPDGFDVNPNVIMDGVKLVESADLAGCVVTGGMVGGAFERTALVGVDQLGSAPLGALADAIGWPRTDVAAEFLGARGSDRSFWRLVHGDDRAIAIEADCSKRPENARYASHARLLASCGVAVPRVLADCPACGALALEELPCGSLEDRANAKGADLVALYSPVVKMLRTMHDNVTAAVLERDDIALEPAFGPDLYRWERDLFEEHCLKGYFSLDEGMPAGVRCELEEVARRLTEDRQVVVHRDFQSTNVLYRADGSFAFIDFQGMRFGSPDYDLASLLYDPYVALGERERTALAKLYPVRNLAYGAVQRLVQALGAFGRLASVGQGSFLRHVPRALDNLLAAADEANLDELGGFVEELEYRQRARSGELLGHHHHDHDEEEG